MWTKELFGTDIYHLVTAFVIYSILGWLVESIYMSICNKKITNRGFAKGPFCPIYGFGAVIGNLVLTPLRHHRLALYFAGAISATFFEFLVGMMMIRLLGELWWDYNEKPFNYKGIVCLESTIAWGFYAIGVVCYLNDFVYSMIDRMNMRIVVHVVSGILLIAVIDYIVQLLKVFKVDVASKREAVIEKYRRFKARWY